MPVSASQVKPMRVRVIEVSFTEVAIESLITGNKEFLKNFLTKHLSGKNEDIKAGRTPRKIIRREPTPEELARFNQNVNG